MDIILTMIANNRFEAVVGFLVAIYPSWYVAILVSSAIGSIRNSLLEAHRGEKVA